jgi:hypothetical protein
MREDDMNSTNDTAVVAGRASGQTTRPHRLRRLVGTGVIATLAAMAATPLPLRLLRPSVSTSRSPVVASRSRWPGSPW